MREIFILANGAMAKALALGLKDKFELSLVGRNEEKLAECRDLGFKTLLYKDFSPKDKNIILAFKPYALKEIMKQFKGEAKVVISVLAGVDFEALKSNIKAQNYARIMPNIAAKFKASTTPFVLENARFKDEILEILNSFGKAYELESEAQLNAATAISGCAPAFLALVAESIANGGVYEGLNKNLSQELTQGLFESFTALLKHEHPALIKEQICSPAGLTIKGIKSLEKNAVRAAFYEAISQSVKK